MAEKKEQSNVILVVSVLLGIVFIASGVTKFIHANPTAADLRAWGPVEWARVVIATVEIGAGACLLIPPVTWLGAAILTFLMVATVLMNLKHEPLIHATVPGLLLISLAALTIHRFPRKAAAPPPAA
jgi:uncharacterized membrane protein YphA (DoxX/SURF4 family)